LGHILDILLINPGQVDKNYVTEHLGIASLKAYLVYRGFSADILDMAIEHLGIAECSARIIDISPKVVGISLLDASKTTGMKLIQHLRINGFKGKIIVGGYFATFSSSELLRDYPEIDFVVRGEGELTLEELLSKVINDHDIKLSEIQGLSYRGAHQIIENPSRPLIKDLDILPPVDRKYAGQILQSGAQLRLYASRGCWGRCTFCDIIGMYGQSPGKVWRRRSVKNLVDEIQFLVQKFRSTYFIFNDDQFLVKGKKALELVEAFATELERRQLKIKFELMCRADTIKKVVVQRLKSVGLQRVFLGLESMDQKQLQRFQKGISVRQNLKAIITLNKLNIPVIASVILADAFTTLKDLLKQFIFLYELRKRYFKSKFCQISVNKKLEVYRGSANYRGYKMSGLLTRDHYLHGIDYKLNFWTDLRLKVFELEEKLSFALINFKHQLKKGKDLRQVKPV